MATSVEGVWRYDKLNVRQLQMATSVEGVWRYDKLNVRHAALLEVHSAQCARLRGNLNTGHQVRLSLLLWE